MCNGAAGLPLAEPVQSVLAALRQNGLCRLGVDVSGLEPYKDRERMPDVGSLQTSYARQEGELLAAPVSGPVTGRCELPPPAGGHPGAPEAAAELAAFAAEITISQAPAAFALPTLNKRKLDVPFTVVLRVSADLPLRFIAGVRVFAADEAAVAALPRWTPLPETGMVNGDAERTMALREVEADIDGAAAGEPSGSSGGARRGRYQDEVELNFSGLTFSQPSQMRPRWLIFAAALPAPRAGPALLLFAHFLVPTIVMSRQADQERKATRLLWGAAAPPRSMLAVPFKEFKRWVRSQLVVAHVRRQLSNDDCLALGARAGYVVGPDNTLVPTDDVEALGSLQAAFQDYLARTKSTLHAVRRHYDRSSIQIVCGLATGAEAAERAVQHCAPGTFVLRFGGGEGGALALSVVNAHGLVEHHLLSLEQLQAHPLEALLAAIPLARFLLDVKTGKKYPKEVALGHHAYGADADAAGPYAKRMRVASYEDLAGAVGRSISPFSTLHRSASAMLAPPVGWPAAGVAVAPGLPQLPLPLPLPLSAGLPAGALAGAYGIAGGIAVRSSSSGSGSDEIQLGTATSPCTVVPPGTLAARGGVHRGLPAPPVLPAAPAPAFAAPWMGPAAAVNAFGQQAAAPWGVMPAGPLPGMPWNAGFGCGGGIPAAGSVVAGVPVAMPGAAQTARHGSASSVTGMAVALSHGYPSLQGASAYAAAAAAAAGVLAPGCPVPALPPGFCRQMAPVSALGHIPTAAPHPTQRALPTAGTASISAATSPTSADMQQAAALRSFDALVEADLSGHDDMLGMLGR